MCLKTWQYVCTKFLKLMSREISGSLSDFEHGS